MKDHPGLAQPIQRALRPSGIECDAFEHAGRARLGQTHKHMVQPLSPGSLPVKKHWLWCSVGVNRGYSCLASRSPHDALRDQVTDLEAGDADQPRLFQRLWKGSGHRHPGAGLGLCICQEVANAHGRHPGVSNTFPGAEFRLQFHATTNPIKAP
ncbi:hypothetical protein LPB072_19570 [Hydrogenophaga crassostreae]|uniref:Histidine kinase n=1 Tax=Hydrogenophaga crassostreae TaxID=1763535 RepID=A0A1D8P092_9BURK|nr:hypothetical protein LPB072_19570 [Hydrogenophaga crassostreae]